MPHGIERIEVAVKRGHLVVAGDRGELVPVDPDHFVASLERHYRHHFRPAKVAITLEDTETPDFFAYHRDRHCPLGDVKLSGSIRPRVEKEAREHARIIAEVTLTMLAEIESPAKQLADLRPKDTFACEVCSTPFEAVVRTGKKAPRYCSAKCKQAGYRRGKGVTSARPAGRSERDSPLTTGLFNGGRPTLH